MEPIPLREVAVLDGNARALGVPVATLMENAGRAVAARVALLAQPGERIYVLAGSGNNGGDGLVAARLLADRFRVTVLAVGSREGLRTPEARAAWDALPASVERIEGADEGAARERLRPPGLVVDALLGAGTDGAPRGPVAGLVRAANASGLRIVSVDIPTGLGDAGAIRASETVTFHAPKEGLDDANGGRVTVADIGIPAAASTHTGPGEFALYPGVRREQHKGEGGVVLVLGGGPYTGAPAVAGLAALRSGADLSILLVPKRAWAVVASYSPNLVVRPLNDDDLNFEDPPNRVALNSWLKKCDAVVVGPGLGQFDVTKSAVRHAVARANEAKLPVVADADALIALSEKPELLGPNVVVTPHAREYEILTGEKLPPPLDVEARVEAAQRAAQKTRATFLVKGPVDVVTDGRRVKRNATGHPAMSVGGTGDALAGIVGALLAKGLTPFDAARLGAWISGRAGELAAAEKSMGLLATDVVEAIPAVLREGLAPR